MTRSVAIVGTGDPDAGAGMAYAHADAYRGIDACEVVACADVVPDRAEAFAAEYGLPADGVYGDYVTMLEEVRPELVSVTVSTPLHAELVIGAARTGIPDAIHCEKPMAATWGDARLMAGECRRRDVQLTFDHQRRFGSAWREARRLLEDGAIGRLERAETGAPNLFDWGTHAVDLCNYFAGDRPAEWVLGAVHYREERRHFGVHHENQGLALWSYGNGVHGLASTGAGGAAVGALNRLVGTDGVIEVHVHDGPDLRVRRAGDAEPETVEYDESWIDHIRRGIEDLLASLDAGTEPALSARRALSATEILFATYESARRRGRVDLPLAVDDHPLEAMVESGDLDPAPSG